MCCLRHRRPAGSCLSRRLVASASRPIELPLVTASDPPRSDPPRSTPLVAALDLPLRQSFLVDRQTFLVDLPDLPRRSASAPDLPRRAGSESSSKNTGSSSSSCRIELDALICTGSALDTPDLDRARSSRLTVATPDRARRLGLLQICTRRASPRRTELDALVCSGSTLDALRRAESSLTPAPHLPLGLRLLVSGPP